jgi:DNA-directed RNA polymerase sigma subunit (sigma70/sigma32)
VYSKFATSPLNSGLAGNSFTEEHFLPAAEGINENLFEEDDISSLAIDKARISGKNSVSAPKDLVDVYLREISLIAKLTPEEEIELARKIEEGKKAEKSLREIPIYQMKSASG